MTFQNPGAFILILLVPIGAVFLLWRNRLYWAQIRALGETHLIDRLLPPADSRRMWRGILWLLTLTALVVALARPVWGVNMDVVEIQGVSVIVALDVSNSMAAQDVLPSRLERAKISARQLFEEMNGNEIGLVLFAGSALVYFPLTTDIHSAGTFLASVDTNTITEQGTALEEAINVALDAFDPQSAAARVIVLMSDGENHEGDIERAIARAKEMGVVIYTIGYGGTEGAPVPVLNERGEAVTYMTDSTGQLVQSYLDEGTLRAIAEQTGGIYQRVTGNQVEIANLVQAINQIEKGFLDSQTETRGIERFGIFLFVAVLALTLEMLVPVRRREPAA